MAIIVTEYLGHRTNNDAPVIEAQSAHNNICPFNGLPCEKIRKDNKPVCSIRNLGRKKKEDPDHDPFWIVCEHRLCSTRLGPGKQLTGHQKDILLQVAREVFTDTARLEDVFIRSEVSVNVNKEKRQNMHADFVMNYEPPASAKYNGKKKLIVEMQGGGETSNTGALTKFIDEWENRAGRTNEQLRASVKGPGILATNAWRRQQEQALVKSSVAEQTPSADGFVLCIGAYLYDYLDKKLDLKSIHRKNSDWNVAIISFKEDNTNTAGDGPIPLVIDKVIKTTYTRFTNKITEQGLPTPDAFKGDFIDLNSQPKAFTDET